MILDFRLSQDVIGRDDIWDIPVNGYPNISLGLVLELKIKLLTSLINVVFRRLKNIYSINLIHSTIDHCQYSVHYRNVYGQNKTIKIIYPLVSWSEIESLVIESYETMKALTTNK